MRNVLARDFRHTLTYLSLALSLSAVSGCSSKHDPPPPPVPEVSVIKVAETPITTYEEYVGQTEAVDTVEIRSRVSGVLERQAFADGARVKKDDLLFVIDQQPYVAALAQARAALVQAQASLVNSRQNLARLQPLLAAQAISQQDLDAAVAKEQSDAANVEAMQAALTQAQLNLGYTTIRAPRTGVMSKALIKPGGLVTAAQTLLSTLYSINPIYVNFAISEQRQLELQRQLQRSPGERKKLALPFKIKLVDGTEYGHPGRLNFIDAAVDPKSGTLQVRLSVPNPDRLLMPGQFVRVIVPAAQNPHAIRVPQKAVQELQGKRFVYVVGSDNQANLREIAANTRLDSDWLVEGGLKPGDMVVVAGMQKVRPGALVKPVLGAAAGADDAGQGPPGKPAAPSAKPGG